MTGRKDCACKRARHQHGTRGAYDTDGCRCDDCRTAHRLDRRARRRLIAYGRWQRFVPSVGTSRRLQALQTRGWTLHALGRHLGTTATAVMHLRDGKFDVTRVDVAERVRAAYDELWDVAPPSATRWERAAATRARSLAAERGYLPPLAWDDDLIDDPDARPYRRTHCRGCPILARYVDDKAVARAVAGERVPLTRHELAVAHTMLSDLGLSAADIAQRLGTTKRTVVRYRSRARAA